MSDDRAVAPGRRFARLSATADGRTGDRSPVPRSGLCLSAFVVVRPSGVGGLALLGKIRPSADWGRIGALDAERVARMSSLWMLPSSHLILYESPEEAARRIVREQLGTELPDLAGPVVLSDVSPRPEAPDDPHWDLGFVFEGRWPTTRFPEAPAFAELAFVDVARTRRSEIGRGHADVLDRAGLRAPE